MQQLSLGGESLNLIGWGSGEEKRWIQNHDKDESGRLIGELVQLLLLYLPMLDFKCLSAG